MLRKAVTDETAARNPLHSHSPQNPEILGHASVNQTALENDRR